MRMGLCTCVISGLTRLLCSDTTLVFVLFSASVHFNHGNCILNVFEAFFDMITFFKSA